MRQRHMASLLLLGVAVVGLLAACGGGSGEPAGPTFPQTLLTVEPSTGSTAGGTELTLTGTGFLDPTRQILGVRVGDQAAPQWDILSDTTMVVTTPPGTPGPAPIQIVGEDSLRADDVILARDFSYVAPTIFVADGADAPQPQLYRLDLTTGITRLLGATGFAIEGMALGPNGQLWAAETGPLHRLIRIDPDSAVGTAVALVRRADDSTVQLTDLTFLEGRLLGRSRAGELVEVDRHTGRVTILSPLVGARPGTAVVAADDVLYLAPSGDPTGLDVYDVLSGAVSAGPALVSADVVESLVRVDRHLYGIDGNPPVEGPLSLFSIEPETGVVQTAAVLPPHASAVARTP